MGGGDAIMMGNWNEKRMHHLQHNYNKIPSLIDNEALIGNDILNDCHISKSVQNNTFIKLTNTMIYVWCCGVNDDENYTLIKQRTDNYYS